MLHNAIAATSGAAPQSRADRKVSVLINAGVRQGERDGLCRIRNVSDGGMAIETSVQLVADEAVEIMLHSGRVLAASVRWVRDDRAGLSCTENPNDVLHVETAGAHGAFGPALPRFYRTVAAQVVLHGRVHRCMLDSIAPGDILLTGAPACEVSQAITIDIAGLGAMPASVCISADSDLFARFATPLPFRLLDAWLTAPTG